MRKRINVSATLVTNSGKSRTITESNGFGNSGLKRLEMTYSEFKSKGIQIPSNYGKSCYNSFMSILKAMYPKDWEQRLEEASKALEAQANKHKKRVVGSGTRMVRKGYTTQVVKA
jgi:hypothetical protein